MGNLENLENISIEYNNLEYLPESIGKLKKLKILNLTNNQLKTLPENIGKLKNLENLDLENNQLEYLPESIGNLEKLDFLHLGDNQLKYLPENIGNLKNLKKLHLTNNQLKTLPESIGNLEKLELLYLKKNQLKTLPESIGKLQKLEYLVLKKNQLKTLPESIGNLEKLKFLNMKSNPIEKIPYTFLLLYKSKNYKIDINIEGTPIGERYKTFKKYFIVRINRYKKIEVPKKKKLNFIFEWQKKCLYPEFKGEDLLNYLIEEAYLVMKIKDPKSKITKEQILNDYKIKYDELVGENKNALFKRYLCSDLVNLYNEYISLVQSDDFKNTCQSESTLTGYEYFEVPFGELVVYDQGNMTYCFTVKEIEKFNGKNPYTRERIPEDIIELAKSRKKFREWYIKTENEDENEKIKKHTLYSLLWDKLDSVPTYPIDQNKFNSASNIEVNEMYSFIKESPNARGFPSSIISEDTHLEFVKYSLKLLGDRNLQNSKGDLYLIDQAMKQVLEMD
jgi:hypothetical protein